MLNASVPLHRMSITSPRNLRSGIIIENHNAELVSVETHLNMEKEKNTTSNSDSYSKPSERHRNDQNLSSQVKVNQQISRLQRNLVRSKR